MSTCTIRLTVETLIGKIPPDLPFPKGGIIPLFGPPQAEGERGDFPEIVHLLMYFLVWSEGACPSCMELLRTRYTPDREDRLLYKFTAAHGTFSRLLQPFPLPEHETAFPACRGSDDKIFMCSPVDMFEMFIYLSLGNSHFRGYIFC